MSALTRSTRVEIGAGRTEPCVWISWVLDGPLGAVVFRARFGGGFDYTLPFGIDAHHRQKPTDHEYYGFTAECEYTGGACWCDGSALQASEMWRELGTAVEGDDSLIWSTLEDRYARWLEDRDPEAVSS